MQEDATTGTPAEQTPSVEQPAQASQAQPTGLPAEQEVATANAEPTQSPTNSQATPQDVQLDADIDDWAAKKGISVSTDNERRLAQIARDNQRDFTRERQSEAQQQMNAALNPQAEQNQYDDPTINMLDRFNQRLARAENKELQNDFFQEFPDAKDHESAIAEKLMDPVNQELIRAGYAEKALRGAYAEVMLDQRGNQTESARAEGAQEALEGLAARQRVATPAPSAVNSTGGLRITPDNVDEVYVNATSEQLADPNFQAQVSEAMRNQR